MRTKTRALVTIVPRGLLAAAGIAQAGILSFGSHTGHVPALVQLHRQLSFVAGGTHQNYRETQHGNGLDKGTGWIPNIQVFGSWMFKNHLFMEVGNRYSFGKTDYNGAMHRATPATGHTNNDIGTANLKVGEGLLLSRRLMVTPYLTYGHRYWNRHLGGATPYAEDYNTNYIGAGVMADYRFTPRLTVAGDVMGGSTFENHMADHLPARSAVHFGLGKEPVVKLSLKGDYRVHEPWHLYSVISYTHFTYGKSKTKTLAIAGEGTRPIHEPNSSTNDIHMDAGVRYAL